MNETNHKYDLSLVITCYNDSEILETSFRKLVAYLSWINLSFELIFVEDCSTDSSKKILKDLINKNSELPIKTVYHEINIGRGGSVRDGMLIAEGKVVGFIDTDLEVPEWYILPCVMAVLNDGYDVVTGYRTYKLHLNISLLFRHLLTHGYRWLIRMFLKTSLKDTETGYKFFQRDKILPILRKTKNNRWFWDTEIMLLSEYHGLKIREIPCLLIKNPNKISSVKILRDSLDYMIEVFRFNRRLKELRK